MSLPAACALSGFHQTKRLPVWFMLSINGFQYSESNIWHCMCEVISSQVGKLCTQHYTYMQLCRFSIIKLMPKKADHQ